MTLSGFFRDRVAEQDALKESTNDAIRALRDPIAQYYDLVMKLADAGELVASGLHKICNRRSIFMVYIMQITYKSSAKA